MVDIDFQGKKLLESLPKKKPKGNDRIQKYFFNYKHFLENLAERKLRNEDSNIVVDGERGKGKSSFTLNSCLILKQLGVSFEWDNICHSFDTLGHAVNLAAKSEYTAHIVDEAIDVAMSRNAMTRINKKLNQIMQRLRKKKNVWFWNIPRFLDLDSGIRNGAIHFRVIVFWKSKNMEQDKKFALAALMAKDTTPDNPDPWGVDEFQKLIRYKRVFGRASMMRLLRRNKKCFICFMAFPAMTKTVEDKYTEDSFAALDKSGDEFERDVENEKEKHNKRHNNTTQNGL